MQTEQTEVFLEPDREVPGQKYVCLSFLSPEKVLASKDAFLFGEFVKDVEVQHKIEATEKFLMSQLSAVDARLSKLQDALQEAGQAAARVDASGAKPAAAAAATAVEEAMSAVRATRAGLSTDVMAELQAYVKAHMSDFRATVIEERFAAFLSVNRKRLEEQFHAANDFRTTVRGLKVRGAYDTAAEAAARAKALQKGDPAFSVFVGQVGFWLPWDPEPAEVADSEYADDQLNTLMKKYRENEQRRQEFFEEQKRQRIEAARSAAAAGRKEGGGSGAAAPAAAAAGSVPTELFTAGAADEVMARKAAAQ